MDQKAFNERIVMSLLRQCAWVWEHCTENENEGEFSLFEVTQGQGRNAHRSKPGFVLVDEKKCLYWNIFNKTEPIDGLEFDVDTLMSRMTFRKDDGYDFQFSFPIGSVFDVTRDFCIGNACQALMGKMVFGYRDGERWSLLPGQQASCKREVKPRTEKKFFCHYLGTDGNTPKRRSMMLKPIGELLPELQGVGTTPLWYEEDVDESPINSHTYYRLYAQLSDLVAVSMQSALDDVSLDHIRKSVQDGPWRLERLKWMASFDNTLLSGKVFITISAIKAFTEVNSPYLPVLQVMRDEALAEREAESQRRRLEELHERQEEERKRKEEEVKERERVIGEGAKFRDGEMISGSDVAELCRMCGISVHLRTLHNLQQVIYVINGKGNCQYYRQPKGKRKPQLDGCYDVAEKLYDYLQEHYNELTKAA